MQGHRLRVTSFAAAGGCVTLTTSLAWGLERESPQGQALSTFPAPAPPSDLVPALPPPAAWLKRLGPTVTTSALTVHICGAHRPSLRRTETPTGLTQP